MGLTSVSWRKSSCSGSNGVEVADLSGANWRISSWSSNNGGSCIQVAGLPGTIAVRDSKDPDGPALLFTTDAWSAFLTAVSAGDFPTG